MQLGIFLHRSTHAGLASWYALYPGFKFLPLIHSFLELYSSFSKHWVTSLSFMASFTKWITWLCLGSFYNDFVKNQFSKFSWTLGTIFTKVWIALLTSSLIKVAVVLFGQTRDRVRCCKSTFMSVCAVIAFINLLKPKILVRNPRVEPSSGKLLFR